MPAQRKSVAISTMALMTVGTEGSLNALPMMQPRGFRGFTGMFFVGGLGFPGVAFAFIAVFFPPHNLTIGNHALYVGCLQADYAHSWLCRFLFRFLKSLDGRSGQKQKTAFNPMATMEIEHDCKEHPA